MELILYKVYQPELHSLIKKASNRLVFSQQSPRPAGLIINQLRPDTSSTAPITKGTFLYHFTIGRGGFGKVWKVELKRTKQYFALKEMQKQRVITKRSIHSVMNEVKILKVLKSPFIVNMHFAFQDRENLYLVLDLKKAGDLRYQLSKVSRFTEPQIKFFTCCIILGLKLIHSKGVVHRDIKPENLVFDEQGYLFITDFGVAKFLDADRSFDTSGTPSYMAPEVLFRQSHNSTADYFALGVILYELIMGKRPYFGRERKEIRNSMLCKQAKIAEPPENFSKESSDFVNKLLIRKVENRLGNKGFDEIVNHPWLQDVEWGKIERFEAKPLFVPKAGEGFDPKRCSEFKDEIDFSVDLASVQGMFNGYSYDSRVSENKSPRQRKSVSIAN